MLIHIYIDLKFIIEVLNNSKSIMILFVISEINFKELWSNWKYNCLSRPFEAFDKWNHCYHINGKLFFL